MPTVSVNRDSLFKELGETYSDDEFQNLCFAFGLELDEVTTEKQMLSKEQGIDHSVGASEEIIYRIDVPANRYDLLCIEGLVSGLQIFMEKIRAPRYRVIIPKLPNKTEKIIVTNSPKNIRPFIVGAVLRNIKFTQQSYTSFIDLQDKLHQNICRKRSLVSIGTHDLDTVKGPFYYDAKPPQDIRFIPLNQEKEYSGLGIMDLYANHAQLKQYLSIIRGSQVYPVVYDSQGTILSLPPIINSNHSKITLNTKNVLIEATATDLTKAKIVLDTLVCAFSKYCEDRYTVEAIEIAYQETEKILRYPELEYRLHQIDSENAVKYIGINCSPNEVARLLSKMCLQTKILENNSLEVEVPPTRHDVIHACDIYEDIAIAWGYNNIARNIPKTTTIGLELPLNKLSDHIREGLSQAGFTEALTFSLCSKEDISEKLGWSFNDIPAVKISNPKTSEFQVGRTCLLSGLLKTLAANKKMPLPLKLFEVSDIMVKDPGSECGAKNQRRLCAVYSNKSAGFEKIHGLLDRIMQLIQVPWNSQTDGYYLRAEDDPTYFPQRCAVIMLRGNVIGKMGVLHPNVVHKFDLHLPCSALEITIEPFV